MTKRANKWLYLYVIQGYYGSYHGWEDLCQSENKATARGDLASYRENEPMYPHRLISRREPNPDWRGDD